MTTHRTRERSTPKLPAAEELVQVTYTLRELEAVMKALVTKKHELLEEPGKHERALIATISAKRKTAAAIDITIHRRKNKDI